jgi:hypothetical protein
VLAGVYVVYFTDWFKPKIIHITSINARTSRIIRVRANAGFGQFPVIFKLGRPYKLTELKVVALDEWQTNKNCLPLWHLIAGTNSVPMNGLSITARKFRHETRSGGRTRNRSSPASNIASSSRTARPKASMIFNLSPKPVPSPNA